jgi:hypothetical protein
MSNCQELYQQANQLPPLEKLRLTELLLADLDTPNPEIDIKLILSGGMKRKKDGKPTKPEI